jgi:hypothetical protein
VDQQTETEASAVQVVLMEVPGRLCFGFPVTAAAAVRCRGLLVLAVWVGLVHSAALGGRLVRVQA